MVNDAREMENSQNMNAVVTNAIIIYIVSLSSIRVQKETDSKNKLKIRSLLSKNMAEALTMINRVLNRVPETADDLLADMTVWPDNNDKSEWYYLAIQEATNSHNYNMKNPIYEKWTAIKKGTDWIKYQ